MPKSRTMLTIKHKESEHSQEISQEEFDALLPRIQEKYKITSTKEIVVPAEATVKA